MECKVIKLKFKLEIPLPAKWPPTTLPSTQTGMFRQSLVQLAYVATPHCKLRSS